jgi:hypothetical protein
MNLDVEPIPEGFVRKLLDAYGLQWTHLVIISGVVFSSFGLEAYLNPGIWILGTVASFGLVLLFRSEIQGKLSFPRAAAIAAAIIIVGSVVFVLVGDDRPHQNLAQFTKAHSDLVTVFFAVLVALPVGTAILSYRASDELKYEPLAPHLAEAVKTSVAHSAFAHDSVSYVIQLSYPGEAADLPGVVFHYTVTMNVVNRLRAPATYRDVFDPAGTDRRFLYAAINGRNIPRDADRLAARGLLLAYEAKALERFQVTVEASSIYHLRDNELVGTYLPCERLSITLKAPPEGLSVDVQSLLSTKVDATELETGDLVWEHEGLLPFQGARIHWGVSAT